MKSKILQIFERNNREKNLIKKLILKILTKEKYDPEIN